MDTESITYEIQRIKGGAARSARSGSAGSASPPSLADTAMTDGDGRSLASESGIHASQIALPSPSAADEGPQEGGQAAAQRRKTKRQLWDDLTISCESQPWIYRQSRWLTRAGLQP